MKDKIETLRRLALRKAKANKDYTTQIAQFWMDAQMIGIKANGLEATIEHDGDEEAVRAVAAYMDAVAEAKKAPAAKTGGAA